MLSLVRGPVNVTPMEVGDPAVVTDWDAAAWVDGWGLLILNSSQGLQVVHVDGKAVRVSTREVWAGIGWSHDDRLCLGPSWRKVAFPSTAELSTAWVGPTGALALMADRALQFDGANVKASTLASPPVTTVEFTFAGFSSGAAAIFPADLRGQQRWWVINLGTAKLALYDAVAKTEVVGHRTSLGVGPLKAAAYSRALDLFFAIRRVGGVDQLSVYANEPVAATIAAPTFSAAPRAGSLRTVRSQVLGDQAEPCAERVVTFTATTGTFDRASVETDAAGWAETVYKAPAAPATGASVTATLVE